MADHMPTAPGNFANALQNDFEFWADNQDDLNERFNAPGSHNKIPAVTPIGVAASLL